MRARTAQDGLGAQGGRSLLCTEPEGSCQPATPGVHRRREGQSARAGLSTSPSRFAFGGHTNKDMPLSVKQSISLCVAGKNALVHVQGALAPPTLGAKRLSAVGAVLCL